MTAVDERSLPDRRRPAPDADPYLRLDGVSVRFGGVQALDQVTLAARSGEVTGLIGPNGAGKSTLLAVASGLQVPASGTVHVAGTDLTGHRPQAFAKAEMARTFQSPQLVRDLDVRQHIVLAMRVRHGRNLGRDLASAFRPRISQDETARSDRLMETLGLTHVRHAGAMELPLGTRRLVDVAQCVAMDPRVLLLDEPTAGLDRRETEAFADLVSRFARDRNIAVVLVEHDVDLVLSLSSRIFVLDFGKLIASGAPEEIRTDPAVQAAYLGSTEVSS
jgi:ABC-type branched-subunit amino acid transport system ATPase component